jgi:hypothetical protein
MNLNVDEDVPAMLAEIAGSQRRMGEYLSNLIRSIHGGQKVGGEPGDLEMVVNATRHLSAKMKELDARQTQLEQQVAAINSKLSPFSGVAGPHGH